MIIRTLESTRGTEREVRGETWVSRRLLLKQEGMGFSMHDTTIHAGTTTSMCYKHHLEAVYCVSGRGEIVDLVTSTTHPIEPGTLYALDAHDPHILRAFESMRMVCVFTPPLTGGEVHGPDGAYPPPRDETTPIAGGGR